MKKNQLLALFILSLSLTLNIGFAQEKIIKCYTEEHFKEQAAKNPSLLIARAKIEKMMADYKSENHSPFNQNQAPVIIPVVVHVMHENGPENISKAQILDQIRILNEDFQRRNPDTVNTPAPFKPIAANCNLEFRLATKDPSGNCTDGINRVYSHLTNNARDNIKSVIQWDNTKYFNIWLVKSIEGGGGSGIVLGFSSFPGLDPSKDGIVVRSDCFGSIGTAATSPYEKFGRSSTHEVGHYLNLFHIWGDDNGACTGSDQVSDTPNSADQHFGCSTFPKYDNCNSTYPGIMFMNYMDYSSGDCTNMFTIGQKDRMYATLNGVRNKLWSSANLIATGTDGSAATNCAPKPDIYTNQDMICEGDSVKFTDMSWHGVPDTWSWSFPGGTPSTSPLQNPVVKYFTAGNYDVTLTSSNSTGGNTVTKTARIFVSSNTAVVQDTLTHTETFDSTKVPGQNWYVINDSPGPTWAKALSTNTDSVMRISAYAANVLYAVDEMISPSFNLTKMPSPMLKFKVAYARKSVSTNADDILSVMVSHDCGKTWTTRYSKSGTVLATTAVKGGFFNPSSSEWRTETVSLATVQNKPSVRIKFQFKGGAESNNIYINDFYLYSNTMGIDDISSESVDFQIYPNPSQGISSVRFNMPGYGKVNVSVHDLLGREIWNSNEQKLNDGTQKIDINTSLNTGMYFVTLNIDGIALVKKLIVE